METARMNGVGMFVRILQVTNAMVLSGLALAVLPGSAGAAPLSDEPPPAEKTTVFTIRNNSDVPVIFMSMSGDGSFEAPDKGTQIHPGQRLDVRGVGHWRKARSWKLELQSKDEATHYGVTFGHKPYYITVMPWYLPINSAQCVVESGPGRCSPAKLTDYTAEVEMMNPG